MFAAFFICLFLTPVVASWTHAGASVQLFEWSWADVANECETFLSKKGYKAVQVSPPNDHIQGSEWWTRYQPVTYNLISRSGDENAFKDMVKRCNAVGVAIVVDAVINHMAAGSGTSVGGAKYGSRSYPYYSPNDFHHDTNSVYTNCQVNNYKDKHNVQSQIVAYFKKLYSYGVRGLRIDAAKHQDATELKGILSQLPSDMYVGQEVIGSSGEAVQPSMYYGDGEVSEFYYADDLDANIIPENKMYYLQTFGESWGLMPEQYAVAFLDNHDTQRNGRAELTYKNATLYTFANMFMLAHPYGNARVMSSYYFSNTDQGPPSVGISNGANCMDGKHWVCEHRWTAIANMAKWRSVAGTTKLANWQNGATYNQIAFARGNVAFIAFNRGSSVWNIGTLNTGLPAGTYCNIIADENVSTCPTITVNSNGQISSVSVPAVSAIAIHVKAKK